MGPDNQAPSLRPGPSLTIRKKFLPVVVARIRIFGSASWPGVTRNETMALTPRPVALVPVLLAAPASFSKNTWRRPGFVSTICPLFVHYHPGNQT
jgi:hypothetical protein